MVIRLISYIFRTNLILLLGFVVLFQLCFDVGTMKSQSGLLVLNRLRPDSFQYLVDIMEGQPQVQSQRLQDYGNYFKKVTQLVPDDKEFVLSKADAYGMMGFCAYHRGEFYEAIDNYKKAVELNPHYFWFHYNLGVLYYKTQQYELTIKTFKEAFQKEPKDVLNFVYTSKIYMPILQDAAYPNAKLMDRLIEGYRDGYFFITMSNWHLNRYLEIIHSADYAINLGFGFTEHFYYYAGRSAYELKEYNQAVYFLRECLKADGNYIGAYRILSMALKELGENDLAQRASRKVAFLEQTASFDKPTEETIGLKIF